MKNKATLKRMELSGEEIPRWMWLLLLGMIAAVYVLALPITIMEPDAAVYATLAKTMVQTGNYLDLYLGGADWLDKPHFHFWVTALSFNLFGINTIAYKFPALLFILLAAFYTYRFAREWYGKGVARLAVLILLTAEHLVISNIDVRAEPFLTGLIIAAVYHFHKVQAGTMSGRPARSAGHLLLGALYSGCAVMTKGIYVLVPIGFAVIGEIVIKRRWRHLFHPIWLLAIALTVLSFSPELYALYHQFDAHPEKTVFGQTGVSGIRFFLWDSQWGRFANSGPIRMRQGDKLFFLHTLLWAFLPWAIMLYAAIIKKIKRNLPRVIPGEEFYTLVGTAVPFVLFSLSGFQLPYYTNILFPFLAILTADYITRIGTGRERQFYRITQYVIIGLMLAAVVALHLLFRPAVPSWGIWFLFIVPGSLFLWLRPRDPAAGKVAVTGHSVLTSVLINLYLILIFYPDLLRYQAGSEAAKYVNRYVADRSEVALLGWNSMAFDFYLKMPLYRYDLATLTDRAIGKTILVLATEQAFDELKKINLPVEEIRTFDYQRITMMTLPFLNYRTREEALTKRYLLRVGSGD